ncbi:uncharacterized protein DUF3568 [Allofrancisella inopinata]|uniref:DUF3568 family protein n=1 Tax=Allofrancisella inopinata TaxID=1085647 RepID=A0AAE6YGI5_9GAMM|nr:DUF3568 family protein [Allofrancisella inopinata]QIV95345.1 DUF3568 family protein [Allofrancisella inopinata]TDT66999.1 uncharacterized protein DUF3568 [Allofrancisella inopinata]
MLKKFKPIVLGFIIATALNSCVLAAILVGSAAVAGGTVYYINGNYVIEIPKDVRSVYNATIKTFQTNNLYSLNGQSYSQTTASISGKDSSEEISVTLKDIDKRSTEVKIRFGMLGDKQKSADLANQITKNIT